MSAVKTYDAGSVTVIFGAGALSGFSEDAAVTIEQNEDAFTLQVGVDGRGTRSKTNNRSARITVSLMQTSAANDILSAIHNLDDLGGQGVFPLLIKDGSGRSLHTAESAWIAREPSATYARDAGAREWIIETHHLVSHHGGN